VAVLFRSVRSSAPPLIDALRSRRIPFTCGGRTGLFLQPDITLLGEIFAWFVDGKWRDERFGDFRPADIDHIVSHFVIGLDEEINAKQVIPTFGFCLRRFAEKEISGVEKENPPSSFLSGR
jgi:hypothetical protein